MRNQLFTTFYRKILPCSTTFKAPNMAAATCTSLFAINGDVIKLELPITWHLDHMILFQGDSFKLSSTKGTFIQRFFGNLENIWKQSCSHKGLREK